MKTALITTTINVPKVLALYYRLGPGVEMFVAGDHKTPPEAEGFCNILGICHYYSVERQRMLGYKSSELIGWNSDSRRNIALLEAVKWGAEIIFSCDDDMIPTEGLFHFLKWPFETWFSGLCLGNPGEWFNAGEFTIPPAKQRGLPVDVDFYKVRTDVINGAKIGAVQGIILGVPDTDAMTAITNRPIITGATDILRNGFVAHPDCLTVFNSQLTAFRRELAPGFAQFYKWQGRNTDIMASIIIRRMMQAMGLYTYFGPPMAFHAREPRPLFNDLKAEMYGLEHIVEFAEAVNDADILMEMPPVDMTRAMYDSLRTRPWFAAENYEAAMAWCEDIETVL